MQIQAKDLPVERGTMASTENGRSIPRKWQFHAGENDDDPEELGDILGDIQVSEKKNTSSTNGGASKLPCSPSELIFSVPITDVLC